MVIVEVMAIDRYEKFIIFNIVIIAAPVPFVKTLCCSNFSQFVIVLLSLSLGHPPDAAAAGAPPSLFLPLNVSWSAKSRLFEIPATCWMSYHA